MEFSVRQVDGWQIIDVSGQVRISTQNEFKDYFDKLIERSESGVVIVNMSGVGYMNSAGIGIIVDSYKKLKERGGRLILVSLVSDIQKLFEVTKLKKFIEIYNTEEEALIKVK